MHTKSLSYFQLKILWSSVNKKHFGTKINNLCGGAEAVEELLKMERISKRFDDFYANKDVSNVGVEPKKDAPDRCALSADLCSGAGAGESDAF